jgi:hypothetical protein
MNVYKSLSNVGAVAQLAGSRAVLLKYSKWSILYCAKRKSLELTKAKVGAIDIVIWNSLAAKFGRGQFRGRIVVAA